MNPETQNSTPKLVENKPSSETTNTSMDFELVSKKPAKFPILIVFLSLILVTLITVGVLIYLKIIVL